MFYYKWSVYYERSIKMSGISPVMEFLRTNGAKAINKNSYYSRQIDRPMQSCIFVDKSGNYLGLLRKSNVRWVRGHAYQTNYIETVNGLGQERDFTIQYAKILGQNGEKDVFIPEKITKEFTIKDKAGNFFKEVRERVVSSKLKQVGENTDDRYKIYEALEPIQYKETILSSGPVNK